MNYSNRDDILTMSGNWKGERFPDHRRRGLDAFMEGGVQASV